MRCFALDLTATNTTELVGLSLRSIHNVFFRIRTRLAQACRRESMASSDDVEVEHINGIEAFWSFAKRRLQKFNGIPDYTFNLHLKECEWRFNHRNEDLYQALLKLLRRGHPL